jgi:demethylmenaquinone methyltransferase/2-methoxy-6-polyprenyl-1,4-benzoquinol methylase
MKLDGPPPLRTALATPEGKYRYVGRLFDTIADRYDLITVLLSFGQDRRWKTRLAGMAGVRPGMRALDLACGTGDIAFELAARGAQVVGIDLTHRMLELAVAKRGPRAVGLVRGDMMRLPVADRQFDIVTTGYGIRNVPEVGPALDEIHRVLKPGGVLLSLDFNRPNHALVRRVYLGYLTIVGSTLGYVLHRDPNTYRYIPETIRRYPGAEALRDLLLARGFERCEYVPVLGGLMAINTAARKP